MNADDPVLIVLVNQPRDLDLARFEHWYRIPERHAPRLFVQARYLAFYQARAFGEDKWTIREYAQVRGHELVRRRDLFPGEIDHPRNEDPYLKVQLGPMLSLAQPIKSRTGRRVLFIWTKGERFSSAVELNDLISAGPADDALWSELKASGIPAERRFTLTEGRNRYRVDYWIVCVRGNVVVSVGGSPHPASSQSAWHSLWFSEGQVIKDSKSCRAQIVRLLHELGNVKYTSEQPS